ncbi:MAG: glutathione S-transferase family protein [Candidatus Omnitrophica bacterium]|nr:glutathione S-transferase family protein [Candidatus Omnitrophota bacterium]
MLKIYGADLSGPANKVRMAAHALGIEYEYIRISIRKGANRTEEYLRLHPAGKIPVIDDDGFILFESDAIIKYLASKKGSPLYPADLKQRALIDQWMDFITIHVGGSMGKVVYNRVFASFAGAAVDENSLEEGLKFLRRFLPVIDNQLFKNAFVAGKQFSLADIGLLAAMDPAEAAGIDPAPYKRLSQWRKDLQQKEFYTRCHSSYEEALKKLMAKQKSGSSAGK